MDTQVVVDSDGEEAAAVDAAAADTVNSSLTHPLIDIIVSKEPHIRDLSLAAFCVTASTQVLLQQCEQLDSFRRQSANLYERVRACFFLYAIHRFHLEVPDTGDINIPYGGFKCLSNRQFAQAIDNFLEVHHSQPSKAISSALAKSYYHLGFQTLADQVRLSVKNHPGNLWMFHVQLPQDHPQPMHVELLSGRILQEQTPVRMDLSHCGWSDIFFLGMDFPEGARVLNVSIDLAVRGSQNIKPLPPIDCFLQVIQQPILKLTSIDLKTEVTLTHVSQVFDFAKDYLGLLRAGIIASGIVPLGLEDSPAPLSEIFETTIGHGKGLHLTTRVNGIPKGSRLAVSTMLLSSIIALAMRATGQTRHLAGSLTEEERRLIAARAILGEWLGGSGGGWQDSGGIWPGIKLIQGEKAQSSHPEHGVSRGRLLPIHRQLSDAEAPPTLIQALQDHLVLVHGGMAQNVGPILEMVTEKYLLRELREWKARKDCVEILDEILEALKNNDIPKLAKLTTRNFFEPLQTIIPWASNLYTETLIERARERFGDDFLGFWMLGGASGGGMGFMFKPGAKAKALVDLQEIMLTTKREMEHALPFAMDPIVYDFSINQNGTASKWFQGESAPIFNTTKCSNVAATCNGNSKSLDEVLEDIGFDTTEHEKIREDYRNGVIGLKQNRLPLATHLDNVLPSEVIMTDSVISPDTRARGLEELKKGTVAVITLAAGVGSRWTQGAGCVKAINPFCKLAGKHRSFLEIHLAKSRRISQLTGTPLPHVITTSLMTDAALQTYLQRVEKHGYEGPLYVSCGKTMGLRFVPTKNDLQFTWEQQPKLDEQAQKVRGSGQKALMGWAESCGEAADYRDNLPMQCLHPVGHFYEIPNLLLNGTLQKMLQDRPQLKFLLLHNVDTVGADVDPGLLGLFAEQNSTLSFEVIPRQIQDVGGGLACVNGKTRLIEGLALPKEEDEFKFTYYNSMTTWIDIDKVLHIFNLKRTDLDEPAKVADAVHVFSRRLPTYVALKEVKKRFGNGHEDVFLTAQFEKLWSDMSSLDDVDCQFYLVSRNRGSQLKDVSQLDGWLRDGSAMHLQTICSWE